MNVSLLAGLAIHSLADGDGEAILITADGDGEVIPITVAGTVTHI